MHPATGPEPAQEEFDEKARKKYLKKKHAGARAHAIGDDFEAFLIMVILVKLGAFVRISRKNPEQYCIIQNAEEWIDDINVSSPTRRRYIHAKSGQTKGTWSRNTQRDFEHQSRDAGEGRLVTFELVAPTSRMADLLDVNRPAKLKNVRIKILDIDRMSNESWSWWFIDRSLARLDVLNHESEMLYERMWAQLFSARFLEDANATLASTFKKASSYSNGAIASLGPPNEALLELADSLGHIEGLKLAVSGDRLIYRFAKNFGMTLETQKIELAWLGYLSTDIPETLPEFMKWVGAY
ncbi:hypothetical protein G6K83_07855 [Agrobacterium rhizogenes]|uniref:hypothetical protein n=1 Tax=Rhizobium rhizogenes TaxID=359 RepID=UPI001572ADF2|nr:hypothetical protein [Rhizobium rhizogenes]NTH24987.1 hypothetical protein [Rhizobium rhizogenes]